MYIGCKPFTCACGGYELRPLRGYKGMQHARSHFMDHQHCWAWENTLDILYVLKGPLGWVKYGRWVFELIFQKERGTLNLITGKREFGLLFQKERKG